MIQKMPASSKNKEKIYVSPWRQKIYEVIFEADTKAGKAFDVLLLVFIVFSFILVLFESINSIENEYSTGIKIAEWIMTILFTFEYIARIVSVNRPLKYIFSFFGIIDLVSILPAYLGLFMQGTQYLMTVRIFRLLRVFRIFKMIQFIREADVLIMALKASGYKILVFLIFILSFTAMNGTIMYIVEGEENGFTNIPISMYWAIVTLTTVGYGDIAPKTPMGQFLSSIIMLSGYAILAVPTGIVSVELGLASKESITTQTCPSCLKEGHDHDAIYCKYCGEEINPELDETG